MVVFWGGAVEACYQHSLLDSELQPKELIAAAMHTSNAVSDVSGYISGLGTASSAAASSASALRTTAASRSMKLATALSQCMPASPELLVPYQLMPSWESGRFALSSPLLEPGVFGVLATSPITREVTLGPVIYAQICLAGAFGWALTHLSVVPIDVVKTRLQTRPGRRARSIHRVFVHADQPQLLARPLPKCSQHAILASLRRSFAF